MLLPPVINPMAAIIYKKVLQQGLI